MPTDAQIRANRANAIKSTGPRSPEGKTAASRNSFRHGLRAAPLINRDVLAFEDQQQLDHLRESLAADYQPATAAEQSIFEDLVESYWRMRRAQFVIDAYTAYEFHILQTMFLNNPHLGHDVEDRVLVMGRVVNNPPKIESLDYLSRIEQRYRNAWYRAQAKFADLRKYPLAEPPSSLDCSETVSANEQVLDPSGAAGATEQVLDPSAAASANERVLDPSGAASANERVQNPEPERADAESSTAQPEEPASLTPELASFVPHVDSTPSGAGRAGFDADRLPKPAPLESVP